MSSPPSAGSFCPPPPTTGTSWQDAQLTALNSGPSPVAGVNCVEKTTRPASNCRRCTPVSISSGRPVKPAALARSNAGGNAESRTGAVGGPSVQAVAITINARQNERINPPQAWYSPRALHEHIGSTTLLAGHMGFVRERVAEVTDTRCVIDFYYIIGYM